MNKLSPHLTIYKFPITAISSIVNRITGLYLSGLCISYCLLNNSQKDYMYNKYNSMTKTNQQIINLALLYPLNYHILGSLRHFIWDKNPQLLKNKYVAYTSYGLFFGSFITTYFMEKKITNSYKKKY